MKRTRYAAIILALSGLFYNCTYDSTPPGDAAINDSKPLLMLDATGFAASRSVKLQYTDAAGSTTQQTSAEKTDATGRLLYPLYMTRGTRSFTLLIVVDESGDGQFTTASGDRKYQLTSTLASDSEIKQIKITNNTDFSAN